ncbi:MAG: hypothetical protein PVJ86_06460 [Phycisphaerales bacterium]|jgi:hypothetical protein
MISSPSRKKKTILIVSAVVVIGVLLQGLLSSSRSSRRKLGLPSLSTTDENGNKWVLDPVKGQSVSRFKDSSAKPGPPLLAKADVQTRGRVVSIGLVVKGQAGEAYQPGIIRNGSRVPAPEFKIIDESGKVVGSGRFEYG